MNEYETPARPRRTFGVGGLAVAGAVCLVVGLVLGAGTGVAGTVLAMRGAAAVAGAEPGPETDARPAADVLVDELPRLQSFVEDFKETAFDGTPRVEVLDDPAFEDALTQWPDSAPLAGNTVDFGATAAALGLSPSAEDFDNAFYVGGLEGTAGFYDPDDDVLYVRGTDWTPLVEITVVHELVHALQDQQVDLAALTRVTRDDDESWTALSALVEGEASLVEEEYLAEQDDDFSEALFDEQEASWADIPYDPFAEALAGLPYELGWDAVDRLYSDGGAESFVAALRRPPTTLEQLWSIDDWVDGDPAAAAPVSVEHPPSPLGARVVDRGSLGAHVLALLPLSGQDGYWLDDGPLEGWAGDRHVTWRQGSGSQQETCTAIDVRMDDADSAAAAAERLKPWAEGGGEVVVHGGAVSLHRCTDD